MAFRAFSEQTNSDDFSLKTELHFSVFLCSVCKPINFFQSNSFKSNHSNKELLFLHSIASAFCIEITANHGKILSHKGEAGT